MDKEKNVLGTKEAGVFNEVIISMERSSIFNDDHRKAKHNFSIQKRRYIDQDRSVNNSKCDLEAIVPSSAVTVKGRSGYDLQRDLKELALNSSFANFEQPRLSIGHNFQIEPIPYQHATRFPQNRRKSQPILSSRDKFFNELTKKGDKMQRLLFFEDLKAQSELKGCTFQPIVNPMP